MRARGGFNAASTPTTRPQGARVGFEPRAALPEMVFFSPHPLLCVCVRRAAASTSTSPSGNQVRSHGASVTRDSRADAGEAHALVAPLLPPFSEPAAPPKKPPRPGAPCHLASLGPVESYNEGVKVNHPARAGHRLGRCLSKRGSRMFAVCVHAAQAVVVFGLMSCPSSLPLWLFFSCSLTSPQIHPPLPVTPCCVCPASLYSPITLSELPLPLTPSIYVPNSFTPPSTFL